MNSIHLLDTPKRAKIPVMSTTGSGMFCFGPPKILHRDLRLLNKRMFPEHVDDPVTG